MRIRRRQEQPVDDPTPEQFDRELDAATTVTISARRITDAMVDAGARAIYEAIPANAGRRMATWDAAHPDVRDRLTIESRACITAALWDAGDDPEGLMIE